MRRVCAGQLKPGETYPVPRSGSIEPQRRAMLAAGWWATPDQGWRIYTDGRIEGEKPEGERVGMHIHALIDLATPVWRTAPRSSSLCDGKKAALKDFYNLDLGEEFREQTRPSHRQRLPRPLRPGSRRPTSSRAGEDRPEVGERSW
jgi:hypothetical protein